MKTYSKSVGSARIFNKALQSAIGCASFRKDHVICREKRLTEEFETASVTHWPNTNKLILPEVMAPSVLNVKQVETIGNEYSFQTNNVHLIQSDMSSLVEKSLFDAFEETLRMVPDNETDEWLKNNRLEALKQLGPYQYSSVGSLSSSYTTDSNEEMSPLASDTQVSSENSSGSLLLFKNNLLKSVSVSDTRYESEENDWLISHQQEEIKPEKCYQVNSEYHSDVKSSCKSNEKSKFVCKNTSQSSNRKPYLVRESQPKDICVKNSEFQTKSRNCCEPRTENKNNVSRLPNYNVALLMSLKSSTGFLDAHCHIDLLFNDEKFNGTYADYMAEHKDTYPDSYNGCIAVFCKPWTFAKKHMWQKHLEQDNVWGAFGCHPKQAKYYNSDVERYLEYALDHHKVRALGEIGLDYSKENERSKTEQHFIFRRQLKIAQKRNLRVVIHCREADDDTIEIMHEILPKDAIFHLHCFTGSWGKAQKWIEEFPNVYIGITNLVTFPSAVETHEVAKQLPLNRLLLETDAPFFVPRKAPRGTKHSHPGMAIHVAAQIAALKNIPVDEVLQVTCANTRFVYNIS